LRLRIEKPDKFIDLAISAVLSGESSSTSKMSIEKLLEINFLAASTRVKRDLMLSDSLYVGTTTNTDIKISP
jgi:hypothetical protein